MRSCLMAAAAVVTSVLFTSAGALAQGASGNLGVSVELREEVRDSFIFVFFDDVAANPGESLGARPRRHGDPHL